MFPPGLAVVALVAAMVSTAGLLALGRVDLDPASARLAAASIVVVAAVSVTGLTVARARWARATAWTTLALAGGITALSRPVDVWWWLTLGVLALAALLLARPPVSDWIASVERRIPIPTPAVLLMLSLLGAPLMVALIHPVSLAVVSLAAALASWILLWAYSQAWTPALWTIRFGTPLLALGWAWGAQWWGWVLSTAAGIAVLAFAWRSEALLAAQPLEPRKVAAQPILAELAPEDVRRVAGIDERGRSL